MQKEISNTQCIKMSSLNYENNVNEFCIYILQKYNIQSNSLDDKIYIIHNNIRRIKNINNYLSDKNLVYIDFEKYTIREQINIAHNAKYIIAPYGSALTNMIFMQKDSCVLVFWHKYAKYYFRNYPLHHVSMLCRKINVIDYEKPNYDDGDIYSQMPCYNKTYFKKINKHLEPINNDIEFMKNHTMSCMYDIINDQSNYDVLDMLLTFKKNISTLYIA